MSKIALFPSGSLVCEGILNSLVGNKHVSSIVGFTSNPRLTDTTNESRYNQVVYNTPNVTSDIKEWLDIFRLYDITHAIPTNDVAVELFSKLQQHIHNVRFMAPTDTQIYQLIHDKMNTYTKWPEISPRLYPNTEVTRWYIKPRVGHSSIGCRRVTSEWDLTEAINNEEYIVCEEIDGDEYTIECMKGKIVCIRKRMVTRNGMSVLSENMDIADISSVIITDIFPTISPIFDEYKGPWFLQVKGDKLLEVQARYPGSGCSPALANRNIIIEWVIDGNLENTTQKLPVTHILKSTKDIVYLDGNFKPSCIVVDWDDTLRLGEHTVNTDLLACLYDLRKHIKLILSTRHKGDLLTSMSKCCIDPNLFDDIQHITDDNTKKLAPCENSILIDDSFHERRQWKGKWACDIHGGIPILQALCRRYRSAITESDKSEYRVTKLQQRTLDDTYIRGLPSNVDKLQLARLRQHIVEFESKFFQGIRDSVKLVLDIGPDINPWSQKNTNVTVETLDLPGISKGLVGDVTDFVPNSDERYDYVRCSEVLEHCTKPWNAPETLWKLVKPGGWLFVSVPLNFRLHGPNPDGFRFSPKGITSMFNDWFEVENISILETHSQPLLPTHVCVIFRKNNRIVTNDSKIPWGLEKGVSNLVEPVMKHQFTNHGPLESKLEERWIKKMGISSDKYKCIACCNGTVGLDALVRLYQDEVKQWFVQRNSFYSDIQNSLRDATVLPMNRRLGGPLIEKGFLPPSSGIVVTSVFGQMSIKTQQLYEKSATVVLFDHAAVSDPSKYIVGDGAMFSLHETKPLGRGEGAVLVVPIEKAKRLREILSFGCPYRNTTNGKMSEFAAAAILAWWERWDKYVFTAFMKRVDELKQLVDSSRDVVSWIYQEQVDDGAVPASFSILSNTPYDLDDLCLHSLLPVKKYYYPLDSILTPEYTQSIICPIKPYVSMDLYRDIITYLRLKK